MLGYTLAERIATHAARWGGVRLVVYGCFALDCCAFGGVLEFGFVGGDG